MPKSLRRFLVFVSLGLALLSLAAPASARMILWEDFLSGVPDTWSVVDNQGDGVLWRVRGDDCFGDLLGDEWTTAYGSYLSVDNYYCGGGSYHDDTNTAFISDAIDLTAYENLELTFTHDFVNDASSYGEVDIFVDGGSFMNLGTFSDSTIGDDVLTLDASALDGEDDVQVRFRFDSIGASDAGFWMLDDIQLEGDCVEDRTHDVIEDDGTAEAQLGGTTGQILVTCLTPEHYPSYLSEFQVYFADHAIGSDIVTPVVYVDPDGNGPPEEQWAGGSAITVTPGAWKTVNTNLPQKAITTGSWCVGVVYAFGADGVRVGADTGNTDHHSWKGQGSSWSNVDTVHQPENLMIRIGADYCATTTTTTTTTTSTTTSTTTTTIPGDDDTDDDSDDDTDDDSDDDSDDDASDDDVDDDISDDDTDTGPTDDDDPTDDDGDDPDPDAVSTGGGDGKSNSGGC
ncbi:MAG: hypothetical protein IT350_11590 [Deltaproteobacteria bacterium]|nr:hypothetical protein [Deltaproteobacteria bacterium]